MSKRCGDDCDGNGDNGHHDDDKDDNMLDAV